LKKLSTGICYGLMGIQRRRLGKEALCGELMHWSVRLILEAQPDKSTILKDYVMVPDSRGPSWVRAKDLLPYYKSVVEAEEANFPKIEEDGMSREEQNLLELWAGRKQNAPESGAGDDVSPWCRTPNFLLDQRGEINSPHFLYADSRRRSLMKEMETSITHHHGGHADPTVSTQ
jgi:hypothetical protein